VEEAAMVCRFGDVPRFGDSARSTALARLPEPLRGLVREGSGQQLLKAMEVRGFLPEFGTGHEF